LFTLLALQILNYYLAVPVPMKLRECSLPPSTDSARPPPGGGG